MYRFTNNAATLLATSVTVTDATLNVTSGTGVLFPILATGDSFLITVQSGALFEIMECTARAEDVFTVVRGVDNTDAQAWGAGASVTLRIPAAALTAFAQRSEIATLANKVNRDGDIMTGNLAIQRVTPTLFLRKTASSGQESIIYGTLNNLARWSVVLGSPEAESIGNAGSNFRIVRYNDAGAILGTPLTISRATGIATFAASPLAPTPASSDNSTKLATTAWAQDLLQHKAPIANAVLINPTLSVSSPISLGDDTQKLTTTAWVNDTIDATIATYGWTRLIDFTGANQNLAASGYQKLPGGLILQWAQITIGSGGTVWTFPIPFPSTCLFVGGNAFGPTPFADGGVFVLGKTNINAGFDFAGVDSADALVFALGV